MIEIRPATREEVLNFGKDNLHRTSRVWAIVDDGVTKAVAGYYLDNGRAVLWSSIDPNAKQRKGYARAVLTCARWVKEEARKVGLQMYAVADPAVDGSERLLKHLGFTRGYKETFVWPN